MGTAKLDRNNPPRFTDAELDRFDAMTPDEVERNAVGDPDNPPMTNDELTRLRSAVQVQAVRRARDMTQAVFAETYNIALGRLRDWEQGRFVPDAMAQSYLALIHRMPHAVEETIAGVRTRAIESRKVEGLVQQHLEPNRNRPDLVGQVRQYGKNANEAEADLAERRRLVSGNAGQ